MATFTPSTCVDSASGKVQWRIRFVALPHAMLMHPTYSELSGGATKLLVALLNDYVGNNNGHLTATASHMRKFGFNSKDSLARGLRELIAFGYIVRTRTNVFRSPALYAVTWLPINKAPAGQPYDPGVTASAEPLDSWRHINVWKLRSAA